MKKYRAIGLMSGTSLDGLDIACCEFRYTTRGWAFSIRHAETIPYRARERHVLKSAETGTAANLAFADAWFGHFMSRAVNHFLKKHAIRKPDLLASHGHTIFHQPERGFSCQIGSGAGLAALTGITTVSDFRRTDIALGGQGAPLVPLGDVLLFPEFDYCVNLGGFANSSAVRQGERRAFDLCPANIIFNHLSARLGKTCDKGGRIARNGRIIPALLKRLNAHPYFKTKGPKSLGKEWVVKHVFPLLSPAAGSVPDLMHTYAEHVAMVVGSELKGKARTALFTGGGVYNDYLMERIQAKSEASVHIPGHEIIQFKEALIFALLGVLRIREDVNTLKSVTGARRNAVGGCIYSGK